MEDSLSFRLQLIQPILVKFLKEKKEIGDIAKRDGTVPKELCELCDFSGLVRARVEFLRDDQVESLSEFLIWMEKNKVVSVKGQLYSGMGSIDIEAKEAIGRRKPKTLEKGVYNYSYPLSELKKRSFYSALIAKFDGLQSCPHFDPSTPRVVRLFQQERSMFGEERVSNLLFFCCDHCAQEKEKIACDRGITKQGFIYSVNCDLNGLVLEKILREEHIEYERGEKERELMFFPHESPMFFLRDHRILIELSAYPGLDETTVSVLKPKLIVCSGDKARILELLHYETNVLVASEDGFYLYDHTRSVEQSVDRIVDRIVEKLDDYAEAIRGNEHDRLVKAFEKIGQELGYVPQREYGKSGLRVDCVWHDRKGRIRVAIEVETRGGWKKDILSIWELEPKLSIITTQQKTDSVPKALMDFALMKSIPHKLLYINMGTKNAYLFEKQDLLRKYSLEKDEKEEHLTLREV